MNSFNEKVETIRKAKAEMNRQRDCLNNLDEEKEESMETQIALVQDYINRSSELSYVDTYFDNGFTGTNFKRPA